MPKPILVAGIIGAVVVVGGIGYVVTKKDTKTSDSTTTTQTSQSSDTSTVAAIDPDGEYKLFSDPSITKQPEKNALFGNGQTISVTYDQSKGDAGSALFYKLYYIDKKGAVLQLTDSRFETRDGNNYSTSNKVFNSDADGLTGFMEIFIVTDAKLEDGTASGKQLKLGMYPIKFETDKE
jgi:hypothetical protein